MLKLPDFSKDIETFLTELKAIRKLLEQLLALERAQTPMHVLVNADLDRKAEQ